MTSHGFQPSRFLLFLFLFLISASSAVWGQSIVITGTVTTDDKDGSADGVTVMALNPSDSTVLAYVIVGENGNYRITVDASLTELLLSAYRIGLERSTITVKNKSAKYDFFLKSKVVELKEILVQAPTVYQRGDTLKYVVSKLTDSSDRVIGDVLKKVPGMRVKKNGELEYQGRTVKSLMVEGIDLTQGSYGQLTQNIGIDDISSVEILQSFQKVRALQQRQKSDEVAVNLKMKEGKKGIWTLASTLSAGYGDRFLSDSKVSVSNFSKNSQHLFVGHFDNTGNPETRQLTDFSVGQTDKGAIPSIVEGAYSPPINLPQEAYLDNTTAFGSFNNAFAVTDSLSLLINGYYIQDRIIQRSNRNTVYFQNGDKTLDLNEWLDFKSQKKKASIVGTLELNKQWLYVSNKAGFRYLQENDPGNIVLNEDALDRGGSISRRLTTGGRSFSDNFRLLTTSYAIPIEVKLALEYSDLNETFAVSGIEPFSQTVFQKRLGVHCALRLPDIHLSEHFRYDPEVRFNFTNDELSTNFSSFAYRYEDLRFSQILGYTSGKHQIYLTLPVGLTALREGGDGLSLQKWYFQPRIFSKHTFSYEWKLEIAGGYGLQKPELKDIYPGKLYRDYRTSYSRDEINPYFRETAYGKMQLDYSDVFSLFSSYLRGRFNLLRSPYTQSIVANESGTIFRQISRPEKIEFGGVDLSLSKGFSILSLTTRLDLSYNLLHSEIVSGDVFMPLVRHSTVALVELSCAPLRRLTLSYEATPAWDFSRYGETATVQSFYFHQKLRALFDCSYGIFVGCTAQHALLIADESKSFLSLISAYASYKASKKVRIELTLSNLLNRREYASLTYTNYGFMRLSYPLRPFSAQLKVDFTF